MNWVRAIAGVLVLWSSTAWGCHVDLDRQQRTGPGRISRLSMQSATLQQASGNASSLATVGTATSFNIGTPAVTQYYFITAYDFANNESAESGVATYIPAGSPPSVVPPVIGASPTSLSFAATQGGANPATQTLNISNTGGGTLNWTTSENATWLSLSPISGTGNGAATLTVTTAA